MTTDIARRDQDAFELGKVFKASGMFKDMRSEAEAVVKIIAGREFGLGPLASMTGIHMVDGKPTLAANLIAGQIKRHPDYNYSVLRRDDKGCALEFFERFGGRDANQWRTCSRDKDGKLAPGTPSIEWTEKDARAANLLSKRNWKQYPRDMYFARCLTSGARTFCPDVLGGSPVYTAEELGAEDIMQDAPDPTLTPTASPEVTPAHEPDQGDITDAVIVPDDQADRIETIGDDVLAQLRATFVKSGMTDNDLCWFLIHVGVETLPENPSKADIGAAMRSLTLEQAFAVEALIRGDDKGDDDVPGSGSTS